MLRFLVLELRDAKLLPVKKTHEKLAEALHWRTGNNWNLEDFAIPPRNAVLPEVDTWFIVQTLILLKHSHCSRTYSGSRNTFHLIITCHNLTSNSIEEFQTSLAERKHDLQRFCFSKQFQFQIK